MEPHNSAERGFTLIELLVVIAIVAILSVVVVLVLNPAQLLAQSRDSTRISDMSTLRSALALYTADVKSPNLASSTGVYAKCYTTFATSSCQAIFPTLSVTSSVTSTLAIDSTGWIPVSFNAISSGAPLSALPDDPTNNATYYYAYAATSSNLSFKVVAIAMESQKYGGTTSANNVVANDGGTSTSSYEVGTNLSL